MQIGFVDRVEAGKRLSKLLVQYPREGSVLLTPLNESIIVAKAVARTLAMTIDLLTIAPIHHPWQWDEIVGAVSPDDLLAMGLEHRDYMEQVAPLIRKRLTERVMSFRKGRLIQTLRGRTVVVVTEGCRTGLKLAPALRLLARQKPGRIIVASPVIAAEAYQRIKCVADEVHSLFQPMPYITTENFYKDFRLFSDEQLAQLFLHV